jgi:hypothetical protein
MGPFASPTVIHWASGGVTQLIFDENVTMTSDPACPKQMTVIGGKVLSSTVAGISGDFHAAFCIGTNLAITLAPRTTLSL